MKNRNNCDKDSMTVREFLAQFSDDESCLNHLFEIRFGQNYPCPKCKDKTKWHRIKAERAYSCQRCGHHLHPTVGTLFENSRTSLQLWFYAMYLFTTSRHGVSGKELQRQLGVTYKCAFRIGHQIRQHMAEVDGEFPLSGQIECDETYVGGRTKGMGRRYTGNKTIVFDMSPCGTTIRSGRKCMRTPRRRLPLGCPTGSTSCLPTLVAFHCGNMEPTASATMSSPTPIRARSC